MSGPRGLNRAELTHQDIGQMDKYVRMFDDLRRGPDDNPSVGIILCSQRDASVVRSSLLARSEHLFATRYGLVLDIGTNVVLKSQMQ